MKTELFSHFRCMSFDTLKTTIKRVIKEKGLTYGHVSKKIGVSEKTLSDWLGKNTTMDVYDLKKISEAVDYNFFSHLELKITSDDAITKTKKAKVLITLEVEDGEIEKDILLKLLDKPTVKKILG